MWYLLQRERIENDMAIKRRREELIEEGKQKGNDSVSFVGAPMLTVSFSYSSMLVVS